MTSGRHPVLAGIAAVLFDKDGTLLDFDATWGPATTTVLDTLSAGDRTVFAELAAACGFLPDRERFAAGSPVIGGDTDDFAPEWAAILGQTCDDAFEERLNDLYRNASLAHLTGYDDVAATLRLLREAGIPVGLATNDAERTARAHLAELDILSLFDFIAGYDSGFGAKPGPGMVRAFAAAVGCDPAAVALVGDSPHDIHAARAAGAVPVGIARTDQARQALCDHAPMIVENLSGLTDGLGLTGLDQV